MGPTDEPNEITVDWARLTSWLNTDLDYRMPHKYQVYLRRSTGEVIGVFASDDDARHMGVPPTENQSLRLEVEARPQNFLEIPVPDHGTWHKWLQEFLEDLGRLGEYFGSIGGWLKEHADDSDRDAWRDFGRECLIPYAKEVAAKAGIVLNVV